MQTANASFTPRADRPARRTTGELLWEVADLAGGAAVMLLPMLLLAVPGIILFVALPALVLLAVAAAPVVVVGAILVPAYVLVRLVRRLLRPRRPTRWGGGRRSNVAIHGSGLPRADARPGV